MFLLSTRFNSLNWTQLLKMCWIGFKSRAQELERSRCLQPLSSMNWISALEIYFRLRSDLCHRNLSWAMFLNLFATWPQFKRSFRSKQANTLWMISFGKSTNSKTLSALFMVEAIIFGGFFTKYLGANSEQVRQNCTSCICHNNKLAGLEAGRQTARYTKREEVFIT